MLAQSMRPYYKTDTYYIPLADGVYLRGNNSRLILKGKSLYPLLEHLIPHLNGNLTLAEITGGLDADRKRMVTNLIEKLFAHQFLKDTSQDQPHTLRPAELETYASEIAFIESLQTSAAQRFECFCNKRLLLIGTGHTLTALVQASLQCGVRKISVIVASEDEAASRFRADMVDVRANTTSEATIHILATPPSWEKKAEIQNIIQDFDAILHIVEQPMVARAQLINELCVEKQKTLIQAILVNDRAWIGPLVHPEMDACWECAWRRLQTNRTDLAELPLRSESHAQPLVSTHQSLAKPGATILANRLLFLLFQYFTRASSTNIAGKVSVLDLATFLSKSHAFLPHPDCLACQQPPVQTAAQFLEQIQRLQQESPIDPDGFLEKFSGCVDEQFGLFTALDNDDFVQAPLAVYKATLHSPFPTSQTKSGKAPTNPRLSERQPEPINVVAASIDTGEARRYAAQKACEHYAASFVDQRRLLSPEIATRHAFSVVSVEQLAGIQPLALEPELWTWALDLRTRQVVCVHATRVFSALGEQARGIAAGQTWAEALCQALFDWCNYFTVEHVKHAQQAYAQVDLAKTPMTPEGVHLSRLLKATGKQVIVYDVTGPLQIPTFVTFLDNRAIAYSTHCDGAQALNRGLEQAVQQYQAEQFQQFDYALAPVPDLPVNLRSNLLSVPHYPLPDTWPARLEWLLQRFQANSLSAFATPLDHDPALARVLPFIARILVSKNEAKMGE